MSRPTDRHPALRGSLDPRYGTGQRTRYTKEAQLDRLPGWETLTIDHQRWLNLLPAYRSMRDASRAIGQREDWHVKQFEDYPRFKALARERMMQSAKPIDGYVAGLALRALHRLDLQIQSDDPKQAMAAAKAALQVVGMLGGAGMAVNVAVQNTNVPTPPHDAQHLVLDMLQAPHDQSGGTPPPAELPPIASSSMEPPVEDAREGSA